MNQLARNVSFAVMIAPALAYPNSSGAQSPQYPPSFQTRIPEAAPSSSSSGARAAVGAAPAPGVRDEALRDVDRLVQPIPNAALASPAQQRTAPRVDAEAYSRHPDNWKRARIVGYTLGVIAVCFAAFIAYGVVTGT